MRHAKKGLAAKFMIFIFTRCLGRLLTRKRDITCTAALAPATKSEASPLSGADRAAALYSVDSLRIEP
jgi:hypothetical protein